MTTGKNRKKVLIVGRMPQAGIDVLKTRDDVDYEILTDDTVPSLHPKLKDANAVTLGATPFRQAELDAAPGMMVVARLGVGFDAVSEALVGHVEEGDQAALAAHGDHFVPLRVGQVGPAHAVVGAEHQHLVDARRRRVPVQRAQLHRPQRPRAGPAANP